VKATTVATGEGSFTPLLAGEISRVNFAISDAAPISGGRFSVLARRCDSV
jgi:hypothetical protein